MLHILNNDYQAISCNQRIHFLVLHYTALNLTDSLEILTKGKVSAHYLIPEEPVKGRHLVYNLVPDFSRAWHAGVSHWQGRTNLNDTSIGIEIVNLGYEDYPPNSRHWFPFGDDQIETVIALAQDIIKRYRIEPTCVVGHGDIAPGRKIDPGPLFPWKKLADQGIGAWYDEEQVQAIMQTKKEINITQLQTQLHQYGYNIKTTGVLDAATIEVIKAFQMHFRSRDYSGKPDFETCAILENLLAKYFKL